MADIKPIDRASVHRICSGQVIHDLKSAIKELVENSVDAGSTAIDVRLKEFGLELIEVADNGKGVEPANFQALTLKHWTSKLTSFNDLSALASLGFRGEALSSLCAVSDVVITTRTAADKAATRLTFDHNGTLVSQAPAAREVGTTVSVSNLFKSMPVRHKDLKRNGKRELGKALTLMQSYAVILVGVKFSCSHQPAKGARSMCVATTVASSMRETIGGVFGVKQVAALHPLQGQNEDGSIKYDGFVSKIEQGCWRSSADRQFFFLNKRPVDLPRLAREVNNVYRSFFSNTMTRVPVVFLNFTLPPESFDVNVTPDKRKVFLQQEQRMLELVKEHLERMYQPSRFTFSSASSLSSSPPSAAASPPRAQDGALKGCNRSASASGGEPEVGNDTPGAQIPPVQPPLEPQSQQHEDPGEGTPLEHPSRGMPPPLAPNARQPDEPPPQHVGAEHNQPVDQRGNDADAHGEAGGQDEQQQGQGQEQPQDQEQQGQGQEQARPRPSHVQYLATLPSLGGVQEPPSASLPVLSTPAVVPAAPAAPAAAPVVPSTPQVFQTSGNPDRPPSRPRPVEKHIAMRQSLGRMSQSQKSKGGGLLAFLQRKSRKEALPSAPEALPVGADGDEHNDGVASSLPVRSQVSAPAATGGLKRPLAHDQVGMDDSSASSGDDEDDSQPKGKKARTGPVGTVSSLGAKLKLAGLRTLGNAKAGLSPAPSAAPRASSQSVSQGDDVVMGSQAGLRSPSGKKRKRGNTVEPMTVHVDSNAIRERFRASRAAQLAKRQQGGDAEQASSFSTSVESSAQDVESEFARVITKRNFLEMKVCGQFNLGFIIARSGADLFIVDQHASDEKFNFERLRRDHKLQSQKLLSPQPIEGTSVDELVIASNLETFRRNGMEVRVDESAPAGRRIQLVSTPQSRGVTFGVAEVQDLVQQIQDNPNGLHICKKLEAMYASRACRASVMVGTCLDRAMMRRILDHMSELDQPWNCPHGRPTMRHLVVLPHAE